jgi:hypothetical protein
MDIRETVKNTLDESKLTNPSKLYTPFTLFAIFFSIYLKADILGEIFLSKNWDITQQALDSITQATTLNWFTFATTVAMYSLGMIAIYGIAQLIAVIFWSFFTLVNTSIAQAFNNHGYIAKSEYNRVTSELIEEQKHSRFLEKELNNHVKYTPETHKDLLKKHEELVSARSKDIETIESLRKENIEKDNKIEMINSETKSLSDKANYHRELNFITSGFFKAKKEIESSERSNTKIDYNHLISKGSIENELKDIFHKGKTDFNFLSTRPNNLGYTLGILHHLNIIKVSLTFEDELLVGFKINNLSIDERKKFAKYLNNEITLISEYI